ncbi:hypothetical protein QYE76_053487 [Lolium multiflorum]|uniref:Transposase (putative) gypsy type domain-containing protein n=1 Tax=Lolium multiflorum TaxID=4521 RepID=A0AAD8SXJ7_LOLMU|nr:hypothetical protein QYE76_053487 [Lolium multiflorum]
MENDTGSSAQLTGNQGEADSSSQGTDIDLDSYNTRGAWMGSDVNQADIDWLYCSRKIPEEVWCRIPGQERQPEPRPGEYVVFAAHFERGLGLPASDFFRRFLDFYELQPHHLPGNVIFYLSSFAAFMEGYAGITPSVNNFSFFYYLRKNSLQGKQLPYPKPFVRDDRESQRVAQYVDKSQEETNLSVEDIIRAFLSRRVLPLQRRGHKIFQMSGPKDPTRITTHTLSATDLVLKAKQICQNPLSPSGKYGMIPYSRINPPPSENFRRIDREVPPSYAPNQCFHDDCDADPYVKKQHKMGPTYVKRPGCFPVAPPSADATPQVVEHAAPLQAEVGQEFLDNLASRGRKNKTPAPKAGSSAAPSWGRKNKAPAAEAGSSEASPAKRSKDGSRKLYRNKMPVASGPSLSLTRSAPGMPPKAPTDATRTSPPPRSSPVPSSTGKSPASPLGGNTSAGCAAPEPSHHRAEEDFFSPPEIEDTDTSNIGAGKETAERAEFPVPPAPKKKKKKKKTTASPTKSVPETSAPAKPSPARKAPDAPAPTKDAPPAPPAAPTGKVAAAEPSRPEGSTLTAQQLAAVVTAATAPPSGSQSLVLHAGHAAVAASEKASAQLGRITELNRGEVNLGPLLADAEKWNLADLSPATRGLGKDKLPAVDPSGPRSTVQHLSRLRRAVKEFDTAWHDASGNVVLFEELLWEHWYLSEAHRKCQAALPETSSEDLSAQLSALKAEQERLVLEHRKALDAQEKTSVELKNALMQAELRHAQELKDAQAAAEAKLDESLKDFTDASAQLRKELEEESRLLKEARDRNAVLTSDQAEYDRLVIQVDALALNSQPHAHKKVTERRAEQALSNPDAPWDAYDHLVALAARISHMRAVDRHLVDLPDVAMQIFRVLWPGETVPANLTLLSDRLKDAGKRFSDWKRSSARAGADAALRVACSWYEELDLDALHSLRGQAPTNTDPALTAKCRDRAYRIAQSAPTNTFIPPPADLPDEESDEEEEDAGEDEEEAPEDDAVPDQAPEAPAA